MKNVAKCDTWCELQNPVNHRVFERKLRPMPSGGGHVCLGVTHRVATPPDGRGGGCWPPVPTGAAGLNASPRRGTSRRVVVERPDSFPAVPVSPAVSRAPRPSSRRPFAAPPRPRPQVRRDHPLSLSISISGGKETNEDSPSNGERTGNSPSLESGGSVVRIVAWRSVLSGGPGPSPLEWGTGEGDSPVVPGPCRTTRRCRRVGLFGNAAPIGR